jgi:signal transduction histidine kinase/CheY-like chemotaxis protein
MDETRQASADFDTAEARTRQELIDLVSSLHERIEELELELQTRTAELNRALLQAQESDRFKSEFLSSVSHELRTPLTTLRGYLSLMERDVGGDPARYLDVLQQQTSRLSTLMEDLLVMSRVESDVAFLREPLDLDSLVSEVVDGNRTWAETKTLDLTLNVSDQAPVVLADERQIFQVVSNLLSNAIKYTAENGRITVSTFVERAADRTWACVSVADTGYGIPQTELEHLFERFFRGNAAEKSRASGTGLGLAIVREIVDRHGGQVSVESQEGQGSEFVVCLPAYSIQDTLPTEGAWADSGAEPEDLPVPGAATILVVEDDLALAQFMHELLELEGYVVQVAADGMEALRLMENTPPDLIVSDIVMPRMDGYRFHEHVRADERWRAVPFIFLTARAERMDILRGKSLGVDDYLTKPFAFEELLVAVRSRLMRVRELRRASEKESIMSGLAPTAQARLRGLQEDWEASLQAVAQQHGGRFWTAASAVCRRLAEACALELWQGNSRAAFSFSRPIALQMDIAPLSVGTRLPKSLPVIVSSTSVPDERYLLDLCDIIDQETRRAHRFALLISFSHPADLLALRQTLNQKLQARAYDVVTLGLEQLSEIVSARDPRADLRKKILQTVDISLVSTFVTTGPTPDDMFFGREPALRQIMQNAHDKSFAVIGGRRIGKTSMLSLLHRVRLPTAGFLSVYHDCARVLASSEFLSARIADWRPERPTNAPTTFNDLLQSPPANGPVVLLLDEADKLVPVDREAAWQLFGALRALTNSGQAQVILSGERALRAALKDPNSPLFNFGDEVLLGPLDFRAVEELVTRPMKQLEIELVEEDVVVQRIYQFTSGHPNVVQRLCRRLVERLNERGSRRITPEDVDTIVNEPRFQEEDFLNTFWERAAPLERILSLLMAQEDQPYRLPAILNLLDTQGLQPEPEAVKRALDSLVDLRSILKRGEEGYSFAVEAFPLVLAQRTTAQDLLIVLKSQYLKDPKELVE